MEEIRVSIDLPSYQAIDLGKEALDLGIKRKRLIEFILDRIYRDKVMLKDFLDAAAFEFDL